MVAVRLVATIMAVLLLAQYTTITFDYRYMFRHSYKLLTASLPFLLIVVTNTAFWSTNTIMLSKLSSVGNVGVYNASVQSDDILRRVGQLSYNVAANDVGLLRAIGRGK